MLRSLLVIAGPDVGRRFPVSDQFTTLLGRSKHTTTQLQDGTVSRVHCEIEIRNKRVILTDLDSASGTFVNGNRIDEVPLKETDVLQIGNTQMRLEAIEAAPAPTQDPARPVVSTVDRLAELVGHRLSHYEMRKVLAKGQSGIVFEAHDFKNDRSVAMKVLGPEFSQNEDDTRRFVRAMKTMLPLRHANLIALLGAGRTGPYCWVAMELIEGESLAQLLERRGAGPTLGWKNAIRIAISIAKALEFAHGKNVIHRNVTPSNILLVKATGQAKLGDLMLAKAQEGGLARDITKPGEILGDLRYMSPERTAGTAEIDGRTDLYSLGATLYALLTGNAPFQGANLVEIVTRIRMADPVPPSQLHPGLPRTVEKIVLKLLAKKSEDRHASATDLINDLDGGPRETLVIAED